MADLITLARAKLAIPNPDPADDSFIESLIDAATAAIESYCRRTFALGDRDEIRSGRGEGWLQLEMFPVDAVKRIAAARAQVLSVINTDTLRQPRNGGVTSTGLVLTPRGVGDGDDRQHRDVGNHPTLSQLAAAVVAIVWLVGDRGGGYGNWPSRDLRPMRVALNCVLGRPRGVPDELQVVVD